MEPSAEKSADIYHWVAWAHANRKRLAAGLAAAALIGLGAWVYQWNGERREEQANVALSDLRQPGASPGTFKPVPAGDYLKVADEHPGTSAASRARLLGAGALFEAGKYKESQADFSKFLTDYPNSPLVTEALLGVAASLDGQGNISEATSRYKEFIDRHPQDPELSHAKIALARLYLLQNKPELAFKLYEDVGKLGAGDTWTMEANLEGQQLLLKYPNLRPPAPAAMPNPAAQALAERLTGGPPAAVTAPATAPKPSGGEASNTTNSPRP